MTWHRHKTQTKRYGLFFPSSEDNQKKSWRFLPSTLFVLNMFSYFQLDLIMFYNSVRGKGLRLLWSVTARMKHSSSCEQAFWYSGTRLPIKLTPWLIPPAALMPQDVLGEAGFHLLDSVRASSALVGWGFEAPQQTCLILRRNLQATKMAQKRTQEATAATRPTTNWGERINDVRQPSSSSVNDDSARLLTGVGEAHVGSDGMGSNGSAVTSRFFIRWVTVTDPEAILEPPSR